MIESGERARGRERDKEKNGERQRRGGGVREREKEKARDRERRGERRRIEDQSVKNGNLLIGHNSSGWFIIFGLQPNQTYATTTTTLLQLLIL